MTNRGPPSLCPLFFFPPLSSPGQGEKELCHAFHFQQAIFLCRLATSYIIRNLSNHLSILGEGTVEH